MNKEYFVSFLKHHTIISGSATIQFNSEINYTVVAGEDENSIIQTVTFCKNGLIVLANSETNEFWSNFKPSIAVRDGRQIIVFETL
ncbi:MULTISPECIES: hypothetical protein [Streptococcus anginosus group]|uniref:hypothetical protein n=1 Tax=Streptococcus anginosus group TaxID=671232 RepID=UPI000E3DEA47|nr:MULTISPECIES: hypothetical protein [Streptococcus anginosus group]